VVERIEDMPAGTVGFRASGKLTRDDYQQVMEPDLRRAADAGEIRMLFRLDSFEGLERGAWFEDMKTGLGLGLGHHSAWKRSAIVTDVEWLAKAFQFFAWMTPGEVEVFAEDRLEDARRWVAG
jgi:hypothetical protein